MCDPNIRDTQTGAGGKERTQRGPEGLCVLRQLHTNVKKVIPLWPLSASAMRVLTYTHPFSVHRSSTCGLNYCLTYQSAELLYSIQVIGSIKARSMGVSHATRLAILFKQNRENSFPQTLEAHSKKRRKTWTKLKMSLKSLVQSSLDEGPTVFSAIS